MKRFMVNASLLLSSSLFSTIAFAHAVMKDEIMPIAAAPYNWTGFYAGLNAGAVGHTMNITDNEATSFNATIQQAANPEFTGGFQVGYRRQLDLTKAAGVYGIELSANFSDASFSQDYGSAFSLYNLSSENSLKNVCLLQLIGGIAADKTLLFLAAGMSWANITGNTTTLDTVPFFNSFSVSKKVLGTAVGGGVEYAFNEKVSLRFKVDFITPNTYTVSNNLGNNYQISNTITQGALGINYKF